MATLEELARKKFGDLSEAEKKVVQAAPDGTVADCRDLGGDEIWRMPTERLGLSANNGPRRATFAPI